MHIASSMALPQMAQSYKTPEKSEGSGPDNDGDSDNSSVAAAGAAKSATSASVGNTVDVSA